MAFQDRIKRKYETTDGQVFEDYDVARNHQKDLDTNEALANFAKENAGAGLNEHKLRELLIEKRHDLLGILLS
jgi:hypothetical protein